jgi:hypothetical protein
MWKKTREKPRSPADAKRSKVLCESATRTSRAKRVPTLDIHLRRCQSEELLAESEATAAAASFLYKTRCSGLPFQQLQQLPDTYTIKKKETFFNTKSREDSERGAHALLL